MKAIVILFALLCAACVAAEVAAACMDDSYNLGQTFGLLSAAQMILEEGDGV